MLDYDMPMKNSAIDKLSGLSRGELRYQKTVSKAEKAARLSNTRRNERLVDRANRINKRNKLGKDNLAYM